NRRLLREVLDLPAEPLWLEQVHGADVLEEAAGCRGDARIVRRPGQVAVVLTADCLPVLFAARDGRAVAAAHAGWRGLAAGILERTVEAFDCAPDALMAWLGPAIGPQAFEVGEEVRAAFVDEDPRAEVAFVPVRPGHWLCDLYRLARLRLETAGVASIHSGGRCTFSECELFYSYRRDGRTGRMASLIWMEES
ncbi:MAG: peptidoglycan editing factor PgeF, partial [Gammaproteobacteria bacterium]